MSEPRYAVYVVLIEDSARSDMELSDAVDSMERISGDESYDEAVQLMEDIAKGRLA